MSISTVFEASVVRSYDGSLLRLYHSTKQQVDRLDVSKTIDGGLHFGTAPQAEMRNSKKDRTIFEVVVNVRKPRRSRDSGGGWLSKIRSAKKAGFDGIVYLNRFEGIAVSTIVKAAESGVDLDALSDADFRRFAPEAQDSWIVFDNSQFRILSVRGSTAELDASAEVGRRALAAAQECNAVMGKPKLK